MSPAALLAAGAVLIALGALGIALAARRTSRALVQYVEDRLATSAAEHSVPELPRWTGGVRPRYHVSTVRRTR